MITATNVVLKRVKVDGQFRNVTPIVNGPITAERLLNHGYDATSYLVGGCARYVYAYRETATGRVIISRR